MLILGYDCQLHFTTKKSIKLMPMYVCLYSKLTNQDFIEELVDQDKVESDGLFIQNAAVVLTQTSYPVTIGRRGHLEREREKGSGGINGTQIFTCYYDRILGHRYLLWLKIFVVPFLSLDPKEKRGEREVTLRAAPVQRLVPR